MGSVDYLSGHVLRDLEELCVEFIQESTREACDVGVGSVGMPELQPDGMGGSPVD